MAFETFIINNLIPQTEIYLQIARFMVAFAIGMAVTRLLLEPLVERAVMKRSASKKVRHQLRNVVFIIGFIGSLAAGLQAGEFGGIVTIVGAVAAALTVAIGWGMRDEVSNYVVGTVMHLDAPFVKGDYVSIGDEEGEVKEINLRTTVLNGHASDHIIVPNNKIGTSNVKNFTRGVKTKSSINMTTAPEKAEQLSQMLKEVVTNEEEVLESPSPSILFRGFEEDKISYEVRYWVKDSSDAKEIKSRILNRFNNEGVEKGLLKADEEDKEDSE